MNINLFLLIFLQHGLAADKSSRRHLAYGVTGAAMGGGVPKALFG